MFEIFGRVVPSSYLLWMVFSLHTAPASNSKANYLNIRLGSSVSADDSGVCLCARACQCSWRQAAGSCQVLVDGLVGACHATDTVTPRRPTTSSPPPGGRSSPGCRMTCTLHCVLHEATAADRYPDVMTWTRPRIAMAGVRGRTFTEGAVGCGRGLCWSAPAVSFPFKQHVTPTWRLPRHPAVTLCQNKGLAM